MNFFGFDDQEDEEKKIKEISSYWEEEDIVKDGRKKWTQEELDALDVISRAFVRIINFRRFVRRMKRDREEYFSENARKIQAIMRMKLAKNKARERKKQVAKRERKFKEFIKLIRDGFECWMMSRKYGIRAKRVFNCDKEFMNLTWKTSAISSSSLPFRAIYKVERRHANTYKEDPDNKSLCFSLHTYDRVIDLEALDYKDYEVLTSGFTTAFKRLNRDASFYLDQDGHVRRAGKSVFLPLEMGMNAAELSRYQDALGALKAIQEGKEGGEEEEEDKEDKEEEGEEGGGGEEEEGVGDKTEEEEEVEEEEDEQTKRFKEISKRMEEEEEEFSSSEEEDEEEDEGWSDSDEEEESSEEEDEYSDEEE